MDWGRKGSCGPEAILSADGPSQTQEDIFFLVLLVVLLDEGAPQLGGVEDGLRRQMPSSRASARPTPPRRSDPRSSRVAERTRNLPGPTRGVAETTRNLPGSTRGVAETTRNLPGSTRRVAERIRNLPGSTRRVAETTRNLPGSTRRVAETTRNLPGSTRRVAEMIRNLPGSTRSPQLARSCSVIHNPPRGRRESIAAGSTRCPGTAWRS